MAFDFCKNGTTVILENGNFFADIEQFSISEEKHQVYIEGFIHAGVSEKQRFNFQIDFNIDDFNSCALYRELEKNAKAYEKKAVVSNRI